MDIFVERLISISPRKFQGKIVSELVLVGNPVQLPFISQNQLESKYAIPLKEIKQEIMLLKKTVQGIVIKGGEPRLQFHALKQLCSFCQQQGLFVVVETFGTKPTALKNILEHIDSIIFKYYMPLRETWFKKTQKNLLENHRETINAIKRTITLCKTAQKRVVVKIPIVPGFLYKIQDIKAMITTVAFVPKVIIELIPYSSQEKNLQPPSRTFMEGLQKDLHEEFPHISIYSLQNTSLLSEYL